MSSRVRSSAPRPFDQWRSVSWTMVKVPSRRNRSDGRSGRGRVSQPAFAGRGKREHRSDVLQPEVREIREDLGLAHAAAFIHSSVGSSGVLELLLGLTADAFRPRRRLPNSLEEAQLAVIADRERELGLVGSSALLVRRVVVRRCGLPDVLAKQLPNGG